MKKSWIILLAVVISLFLVELVFGEVRINEVMANPSRCSDSHCEYIELKTDSSINLTDWAINTGTGNKTFNFYLEDYLIIARNKDSFVGNFSINESKVIELTMVLNNDNDTIFLYNNSELIDSMSYSPSTSGISWQFCSDFWIEAEPTPGSKNSCGNGGNNGSSQEPSISLELDWDEEDIINGEEFDIEIKAEGLQDKEYDVKIWIQFDNGTIISDRYDEEKDEWKSGKYYVNNFFKGPGNKTEEISLRVRDDYEDFKGNVRIYFKIRDVDEIDEKIKILEKEENEEDSEEKQEKTETNNELLEKHNEILEKVKEYRETTGNVIRIGSSKQHKGTEDIKTQNTIYESKTELIKKYAVFGFALLCLAFAVLVIFKKL